LIAIAEGYIYPREARAVRDLLRKRSQLVRTRTTQILSIQNLLARNLAIQASGNLIKRWQEDDIETLALLPEQKLALKSNLALMHLPGRTHHARGSNPARQPPTPPLG